MTTRAQYRSVGRTLAARHGAYLTDDEIARAAPSVFATSAHGSRSEGFRPIPTSAVLAGLRREGFDVVQARQARSRDEGRIGFTKHMLRLRHRDTQVSTATRALGDVFPEVVLVNANDGSSSYVLSAGLFRLVCLNGMTVAEQSFPGVRVTHWGDVASKVIEGSFAVLDESRQAIETAREWSGIALAGPEQDAFAQSARILRFADAEGEVRTPVTAAQLLRPRRGDDAGSSLWHTFNRVQENAIRGGLSGTYHDPHNGRRARRVTTRPVEGIDQDTRLNRALWHLASELARHKAA